MISPSPSTRASQSARADRVRMPKRFLDMLQAGILFIQLSPKFNLPLEKKFHALPDGGHECSGIGWGRLLPELRDILFFHLFL